MFEHLGYFKEYYIDNKFIGSLNCDKDRELIGYEGKKEEITISQIILDNKKKIKAGISVVTILYPLCGKLTSK